MRDSKLLTLRLKIATQVRGDSKIITSPAATKPSHKDLVSLNTWCWSSSLLFHLLRQVLHDRFGHVEFLIMMNNVSHDAADHGIWLFKIHLVAVIAKHRLIL